MKRVKRILTAVIALLLISTALTAFSVFAEGEEAPGEDSTAVTESSSSVVEESSSSVVEESSSSEEEKSSSSEEEKSSSSEEEKSSSSEEESASSDERSRSSSSSSSAEEVYASILTHDATGISIGLSQPNDKLSVDARSVSADDPEHEEVYSKLIDASKGKELVCCYEVILGGDDSFDSNVTVILPIDDTRLIGRSMTVLFYPERASHVSTSNKDVVKAASPSSSEEPTEASGGVIRISETLEAGRRYYFAVCEVADVVPASGGIGILGILAIITGVAALASGGLLAFLWTRHNKGRRR